MYNRISGFFKSFTFLLFHSSAQVYSLLFLFFDLAVRDWRSASSIFYFSLESLTSVLKYCKLGHSGLNISSARKKIIASKKSLFIMGSGPSVNSYTDEEWDKIRNNDSWGFNLWFCHDFVPSVYLAQSLIEPQKNKEQTREYNTNLTLSKMLNDKRQLYNQTDFYLRGDAINKKKFFNTEFGGNLENILGRKGLLLAEMPISSTNRIQPEVLLEKIFARGFFKANKKPQLIPKFGSTITEMISLALMLGYKEIILCGIDMNDGGHFYDNDFFFKEYPYLKALSRINHTRTPEGGHEHMDSSIRPFNIKEYIVAMKNFANNNFDANIYVMKDTSALFPEIPKFY